MTHDEWIKQARKQLIDIGQRSCFLSAQSVPRNTRKLSGQARASTNMSIGSADLSTVIVANYRPNAISGELDLATRKFRAVSKRITLKDKVFVSSDLGYIEEVEYTYSGRPHRRPLGGVPHPTSSASTPCQTKPHKRRLRQPAARLRQLSPTP